MFVHLFSCCLTQIQTLPFCFLIFLFVYLVLMSLSIIFRELRESSFASTPTADLFQAVRCGDQVRSASGQNFCLFLHSSIKNHRRFCHLAVTVVGGKNWNRGKKKVVRWLWKTRKEGRGGGKRQTGVSVMCKMAHVTGPCGESKS